MRANAAGTTAAGAYYSAPLGSADLSHAPRPPSTPRSSRWRRACRGSAGLVREVVAAAYFGTSGAASAFTLAFQIPNLIRALVADAALSSAFVPVFSDLLEHKRRREALPAGERAGRAAAGRRWARISLLFILLAPRIIPLFAGNDFTPELTQLCVGLSQVLFPIVVLLGLNGLFVGHPQRARPLHDPGDRPAGLERGDHRRDGRAGAAVPRRRTSSTPTRSACWWPPSSSWP